MISYESIISFTLGIVLTVALTWLFSQKNLDLDTPNCFGREFVDAEYELPMDDKILFVRIKWGTVTLSYVDESLGSSFEDNYKFKTYSVIRNCPW